MKKLFVTGGAGFIGSHFVKYILNKYPDYIVINADALTYAGSLKNLKEINEPDRYTFVNLDITVRDLVDQIMRQDVDYIINFAAESHVDQSILFPNKFIHTNVLGTGVLLEAARQNNIKKFVQISTDEVYGSLGNEGFFTEETPLAPNSPYSASKASADMLVRSYHETYGLPINITRCTNNYGSHQLPEKLIPLMVCKAVEGKQLPVYGSGLNVRDWIHVDDHCRAIDLVLHEGKDGEIYNIGSHEEKTNLDIVHRILEVLGKDDSLITHVEDRLGHDFRYALDASKIQNELGWKPEVAFDEGIEKTIKWYVQNMDWCYAMTRRLKEFYQKASSMH